MRSWLYIVVILGIVARNSAFTLERSSLEEFRLRNWSSPAVHLIRRPSVEKIDKRGISPDVENNLHEFMKQSGKKHSKFSEDVQRVGSSDDGEVAVNRSSILDKATTESRESTSGSSIVTSTKNKQNSDATFVASAGTSKTPGSTISTSMRETRTSDPSIVIGASSKKAKTSASPISLSPKETRTSESTIGTFSQETGSPASTIAEEIKSPELPIEHARIGTLKNVVLLLIDESPGGQADYLRYFDDARKFPVRGFSQNCDSGEFPDIVTFSLGDSLVSKKIHADCECDQFLEANVGTLLSWARHVKDMRTGAVSTTNFSVPLPLYYEGPSNVLVKSIEDNDGPSALHPEIPSSKSDPNEMSHPIDSMKKMVRDKRSVPSTSATTKIEVIPKQDPVNGFDGMWNIFDMFAKIRIAFFRILLDSLGNMANTEDEFIGKRPMSTQHSFVELVAETLRLFKLAPNDNGFVLVAVAQENELADAVGLFQREFMTEDTLFVISGICSSIDEPVPFVAHGPGATALRKARTIWDLPLLIKEAMITACYSRTCKNELLEEPLALPSLELRLLPEEFPRNRIERDVTKGHVNETTTTAKSTNVTDIVMEDGKITPEIKDISGAADIRVDKVASAFGIITSIATMLALNSA